MTTGLTAVTSVLLAAMVIPPGGLWGPVPGATAASLAPAASLPLADGPRSTGEMSGVNPDVTLTSDDFDVVIAASALEAVKSSGEAHVHDDAEPQAPPAVHHHAEPHPPEPARRVSPSRPAPSEPAVAKKPAPAKKATSAKPAATKPTAVKPAAKKPAAIVYTCPMHPEVTSPKPGTCPKCGMALVKK